MSPKPHDHRTDAEKEADTLLAEMRLDDITAESKFLAAVNQLDVPKSVKTALRFAYRIDDVLAEYQLTIIQAGADDAGA